MVRFQKILCPVDFFPASLRAFDYALRLAANYDAGVHALHVVAPIIPAAYGSPISIADITTEMETQSKRQLQKLKAKGQKSGVSVHTEVRVGDIDTEIRRAISDKKADLLVMGTHGRRGLSRLLMGSVAEEVMRDAKCPVLIVRTPVAQAEGSPSIYPREELV